MRYVPRRMRVCFWLFVFSALAGSSSRSLLGFPRSLQHGATTGVFSGTVEEQHVPYMNPSENGGKADVRWMAVRQGEKGAGLLLQAEVGAMFEVRQATSAPNGAQPSR